MLANIALHGLEHHILKAFPKRNAPNVIRYADDFVILHERLEGIKRCKNLVVEFLRPIGLDLKETKTRIAHTLESHEGTRGFDFLGFTIRQHKVGKYKTGKVCGKPLGFKTIIRPSKAKVKAHAREIGEVIKSSKAATQAKLIARLNPIIRGWSNYFSTACSKETFNRLDAITYWHLVRWANRRHPQKSKRWVARKYWHRHGNRSRSFMTSDGIMKLHTDTPIKRHWKVFKSRSPFDGDWVYWSSRRGTYPGTPRAVSFLIKRQNGVCPRCSHYFGSQDQLEVHHVDQDRSNNKRDNLCLLHKVCHHQTHGMYSRQELKQRGAV